MSSGSAMERAAADRVSMAMARRMTATGLFEEPVPLSAHSFTDRPATANDIRQIVREEIEAAEAARSVREDFARLTAAWDARHGGGR